MPFYRLHHQQWLSTLQAGTRRPFQPLGSRPCLYPQIGMLQRRYHVKYKKIIEPGASGSYL
jgi:hypothetical protein